MSYEKDANYNAQWLFPPSLEDLLGADHPARMVREFVEAQDLKALGFTTRTADEGRPNYSARLMVKVWLYGYMSRIRSTRLVERACMESIGMLWLSGMQSPDHTTLWRFWRDNRKALRKLFKQLLQIAVACDLVGMVLHAVDGTKILSQSSEAKGWHRGSLEKTLARLDEAIDEIMKQTEEAGEQENAEVRLPESLQQKQELRSKIAEQLRVLDEEERDHRNPGDEEARMMKCGGGTKFAYNAQAVVDRESHLIVAADVVRDESDNYQLVSMLEQVEANLSGVAEQTVADAGYQAATEFAKAEEKGYGVLVNVPEGKGPYDASHFSYDADKDQCVCPRGEALTFDSVKPRDKVEPYVVRVYRCGSYETCPVRWQCSKSQTGRTVQIHPNYAALKRQREKVKDEGDARASEAAWLDYRSTVWLEQGRLRFSALDSAGVGKGQDAMARAVHGNELMSSASTLGCRQNRVPRSDERLNRQSRPKTARRRVGNAQPKQIAGNRLTGQRKEM